METQQSTKEDWPRCRTCGMRMDDKSIEMELATCYNCALEKSIEDRWDFERRYINRREEE